jgi:repressor LexA
MPAVVYKRQREILEFIRDFIKKNGFSPTISEICKGVGVSSVSTVFEHLVALEKKGFIYRRANQGRGIEIVEQKASGAGLGGQTDLPLLGFIAAGQPLEPYTDPHASFTVPQNILPIGKTCFVLQVKGDSMVEDGILSGDFVVIVKQQEANDGDIVVALLENGLATLKRFFREADRVRLEPANAKMEPIYATNVRIQGKLLALIRRYS